jgi:uncharacterized protein (TIGR03067 family)
MALSLAFPLMAQAGEKLEPADLEGGYTVISGEKDGKPEPEGRVNGTTVRWTKDRFVVTTKDKEEVYGGTYTLSTSGDGPTEIKMTSKLGSENQVAKGLIKKEGDTITVIYALPGADMPKGFKTAEKQNLFVMKNLRK